MRFLEYKVYLTPEIALSIRAAKLNPGEQRLWFFDENDDLIALFQWADIVGFTVEGAATGQLLTDRIPIEMGKVSEAELGYYGRLHVRWIIRLDRWGGAHPS